MTDRNIDKRLFLSLYTDLVQQSLELKWSLEELIRTNTFWGDRQFDDGDLQGKKSLPLCLGVIQRIDRILKLLLTPDTKEINSFCLDQAMETDVALLQAYKNALEGSYTEMKEVAEHYSGRLLDRIRDLFLDGDRDGDGEDVFGENVTFPLDDILPQAPSVE